MTTPKTVSILREDLDRIASAFHALALVVEHCDAVCAAHLATICERYVVDLLDESELSIDQREEV